jgi:stage V sporulation protein D (sporulation-specific penicillin-binding protein)
MISKKKRFIFCRSNGEGSDNWRVYFLIGVVFFITAIVVWRMANLQIFQHNIYARLAMDQRNFYNELFPERGEIFASDLHSSQLYPLAVNKNLEMLYAVPRQIEQPKETAEKISSILEISEDELLTKLDKPDDPYEIIKHKLKEDTVNKIKDLNVKGLYLVPESWRYYPEGNLLSHILGFVGFSDDKKKGQYGIEGYYDEILQGKSGFLEAERDTIGRWISISDRNIKSAEDGDDLVLTIDRTIQFKTEEVLKKIIEKWSAESGSIIVMDPVTGALRAVACQPDFNPNKYFEEENLNIFLNPVIQDQFEPGSIFKLITMAAALDSGAVTPSTCYEDKGVVLVDGYNIRNSDLKAHGKKTMTQVLEKSLNTGAIFAQKETGKETFEKYIQDFGFEFPTGIELAGERGGNLSNLKNKKSDVNFATASFGQGVAITPLQLITAISAIANNGKLAQPYIVEKFIHFDASETKIEPKIIRQVISPQTANRLSAMMVSVIKNGYGNKAGVEGYHIAGKTGTAQVPSKDKRGYSDKTIHSFVGFGPVPDPKFIILIKLDNPQGIRFAADSTTSTFSELSKFLLNYYQVLPEE